MSTQRPPHLKRNPSEVENPYFRAWALRGSEASSSSGRGTIDSNPLSPRSLPPSIANAGPRPKRSERYTELSSDSGPSTPVTRTPLQRFGSTEAFNPSRAHGEQIATEERSGSLISSLSGSQGSRKSSLKNRFKRLFSLTPGSEEVKVDSDEPLPKASNQRGQWRRETSGHWIEIRVGRRRASPESPGTPKLLARGQSGGPVPGSNPQTPLTGPPRYFVLPERIEEDEKQSVESSQTPSIAKRRGLFNKSREVLGFSQDTASSSRLHRASTATQHVLDKAALALDEVTDKAQATSSIKPTRASSTKKGPELESGSSTSTSASTLSLGIRRWRRRHLAQQEGSTTTHSSATSFLSLPSAVPPAPTPDSEAVYTGSDCRKYLTVDLTDPDGPAFLPSEAKRISTPPLIESTHGGGGPGKNSKLRGFFFDYTAPPSIDARETDPKNDFPARSKTSELELPDTFKQRSVTATKQRVNSDWYRAKVDAIDAIDAEEEMSREEFVLAVPEHLPSSPLCPRHPKHKSGGKGVCVYHGRN